MRKISIWAKHNPWFARIIIIASFIILNLLAFITGSLLHDSGIYLPFAALLFFACLYAWGFIAYPFKNKKEKFRMSASCYVRQKTCDIFLAGSTYLMIVYSGNHKEILFRYSLPFNQALATNTITILPKDSTVKTYKSISAFSASMKDEKGNYLKWKERKKLLKEQIRAIKHSNEPSNGGKTALIILSVLVAILLIGLIASLACSISCGGSDVLAVIVGIGGTALVIWLLIRVIRNINRKKSKEQEKATAFN
jgi:hypothetical protein